MLCRSWLKWCAVQSFFGKKCWSFAAKHKNPQNVQFLFCVFRVEHDKLHKLEDREDLLLAISSDMQSSGDEMPDCHRRQTLKHNNFVLYMQKKRREREEREQEIGKEDEWRHTLPFFFPEMLHVHVRQMKCPPFLPFLCNDMRLANPCQWWTYVGTLALESSMCRLLDIGPCHCRGERILSCRSMRRCPWRHCLSACVHRLSECRGQGIVQLEERGRERNECEVEGKHCLWRIVMKEEHGRKKDGGWIDI